GLVGVARVAAHVRGVGEGGALRLAGDAAQVVPRAVGREHAQPGAELVAALGLERAELVNVALVQAEQEHPVDLADVLARDRAGEAAGDLVDAAEDEAVVAEVELAPGASVAE